MNLDSYIRTSSGWLVDATTTLDLALSGEMACRHSWRPPNSDNTEGPYFFSKRDASAFNHALPLAIRSSRASMMAARVVYGDKPQSAGGGKLLIPFADSRGPRIEAVLARAGIIAQFELWKAYVIQFPGYPTNLKAARRYDFSTTEEEKFVSHLIELRNLMTHDVDIHNDPTARRFVEYTWECQYAARWVTRLYDSSSRGEKPCFGT